MASSNAEIIQEGDVWVIRVENANGKIQEYRCSTERQARQLFNVLSATDRKAG